MCVCFFLMRLGNTTSIRGLKGQCHEIFDFDTGGKFAIGVVDIVDAPGHAKISK